MLTITLTQVLEAKGQDVVLVGLELVPVRHDLQAHQYGTGLFIRRLQLGRTRRPGLDGRHAHLLVLVGHEGGELRQRLLAEPIERLDGILTDLG